MLCNAARHFDLDANANSLSTCIPRPPPSSFFALFCCFVLQLLQELWADLEVAGGNSANGDGEGKYGEGNGVGLDYAGSSASDDSECHAENESALQTPAPTPVARNKNVFAC